MYSDVSIARKETSYKTISTFTVLNNRVLLKEFIVGAGSLLPLEARVPEQPIIPLYELHCTSIITINQGY